AFSSGAGRTSDGNGSHASTLKSPSYTKSVSWQHYRTADRNRSHWSTSKTPSYTKSVSWQHYRAQITKTEGKDKNKSTKNLNR
ncbi:hypothetical protein ACNDRY_002231, partial [Escherichia coli]